MVTAAERQRVGTLIKKRRQELGIRTQADLAVLVGTSETSVAKWEAGYYYPSRFLGKLEAVLRVSLTDEPEPDQNEAVLQNSIDGLDAAQLAELVEAYRAIRNGKPPARERAG